MIAQTAQCCYITHDQKKYLYSVNIILLCFKSIEELLKGNYRYTDLTKAKMYQLYQHYMKKHVTDLYAIQCNSGKSEKTQKMYTHTVPVKSLYSVHGR